MKLNIFFVLTLAFQSLAVAVYRDTEICDVDDNVERRDGAGNGFEVREAQSGGQVAQDSGRPGQPGQPGRPGGGVIPGSCPFRRQAVPWFRRGRFPFPTAPVVGFVFSFKSNAVTVVYFTFKPSTNDYFYTTNLAERNNAINNLGYQNRGTVGFIFVNQRCGGTPLYRLYNPGNGQHFYTVSSSERSNAKNNGWNDEGIAGYLFRN